jgi:hypothetical protein
MLNNDGRRVNDTVATVNQAEGKIRALVAKKKRFFVAAGLRQGCTAKGHSSLGDLVSVESRLSPLTDRPMVHPINDFTRVAISDLEVDGGNAGVIEQARQLLERINGKSLYVVVQANYEIGLRVGEA